VIYACTNDTDLDELIGTQCWEGQRLSFHYGPLVQAMKAGEELVLKNSAALSAFMLAKVRLMLGAMIIEDTSEEIYPHAGFRLTLG
jgi:midasin (ATPase involved in ribosome maturation)